MLLTNLKIAYRNLLRNKGFSFINITGLAIGMACTILLLLFVNHEMSYDKFNKDADRIYQVANLQTFDGGKYPMPNLPGILIETLKEKYPQFEAATNFNAWGEKLLLEYDTKKQYANIKCADPDFFKIFSVEFVKGNSSTCLDDPFSLVITEKEAHKIFGDKDPIGKTVKIDNRQIFTVTSVVKELPSNSSVKFRYLIPFKTVKKEAPWLNYWGNHNYFGYAKITKGTDITEFNKELDQFYIKHVNKEHKKYVFLFPLLKRHLYSLSHKPTVLTQVRMYFLIACFILIIACFNFMNLSTARAAKRAKEIGLKKAIGANYGLLIRQFLGESILVSIIAMNFAILLAHLFLPSFNLLMVRNLHLNYASLQFWIIILGVSISTGILAGIYPAFYLSSFNPIIVLKGFITKGNGGKTFRKILVILQFTLAASLLVSTLIIVAQTNFLSSMDIGIDKKNVIAVEINQQMRSKIKSIKTELKRSSLVESASYGSHIPYRVFSNGWGDNWEGKDPNYNPLITYPRIDPDFIDVFKPKLLEGRFFNKQNPQADSLCIVINEKLAKMISKESVIDKVITRGGGVDYRIIGVIKDYHCVPNNRQIAPFLLSLDDSPNYLFVRYFDGNSQKAIQLIEKICKNYNPDFPLTYEFVDDNYNSLFEGNKSKIKLLLYTSILAIIISCLGLFGLASFTAEERTKEIGVRKVLGASVKQLIFIFTKDFCKWIIVSSILSTPVTYYFMHDWLNNYPYKIDFPYIYFIFIFGLLLLVSVITVAYQSWKSATRNPIESLKYE